VTLPPHTERIDRLSRQIDRQADSTTAAMKARSTVGQLIAIRRWPELGGRCRLLAECVSAKRRHKSANTKGRSVSP
jgi:hypothetical protein